MANLLLCLDSFAWNDLMKDLSVEMDELKLAVDLAISYDDTLYGHPDAYLPSLGWGTVNDLLAFSQDELNLFSGGWLTHDHQKTLIKLWRNPTPMSARSLAEMEQEEEFAGKNNGWIGCHFSPLPEKMVHNENSLKQLHSDYVWENPQIGKTDPVYFYEHYKPNLRIPANTINQKISEGQVHPCFKRLDMPTIGPDGQVLHGEKIGIHFKHKTNPCLYIDGTWKHGNYMIPNEAKTTLEEWGFILPVNQR